VSVVILNDTRPDDHHGCSRVMRLLEAGLERHGLEILARSPVRHDWAADPSIVTALARARLVVINGEGTLHHGKKAAARLLAVVDHPTTRGKPVALVNALWQDNPATWAAQADRLALASLRDSRSLAAFTAMSRAPARLVPDLSLTERISPAGPRRGVVVGDSVLPEATDLLRDIAVAGGHALVPSLSRLPRPNGSPLLRLWRRLSEGPTVWDRLARSPGFALDRDEAAHAVRTAQAELVVTGRFHGACYAMAAGTPFVALSSNSWKLEALVEDAGLARWRLATPEGMPGLLAGGQAALAWSEAERVALDAYLEGAAQGAASLFTDLAALARS
jgi:hypothetical protein